MVDADPRATSEVASALSSDCGVLQSYSAAEALRVCEAEVPDVVLVDLAISGLSGAGLIDVLAGRAGTWSGPFTARVETVRWPRRSSGSPGQRSMPRSEPTGWRMWAARKPAHGNLSVADDHAILSSENWSTARAPASHRATTRRHISTSNIPIDNPSRCPPRSGSGTRESVSLRTISVSSIQRIR